MELMKYIRYYDSPLGRILLAADEQGLTGLWFEGQKFFPTSLLDGKNEETPPIASAVQWLDIYFSGRKPEFTPPLHLLGTEFQMAVWNLLLSIPYGKTVSYSDIARRLAQQKGLRHMSAQAVGGAVGHNNISIIVPCHRVVGINGSLTGYAGGIEKKKELLRLERADMSGLFIPRK